MSTTWEEMVAEAQATGAAVIAPSGLPIASIRHDDVTMEHEHADHPTYLFPVVAEYCGSDPLYFMWYTSGDTLVPMTSAEIEANRTEVHALIYTDGNVAVTLYECQFAMWYVASGKLAGGHAAPGTWKLTAESIEKVRDAVPAVAR